jgi:hypothetical protein
MTIARSILVDDSESGFYHCTSRCVRRAYLCGDGYEHRKDWIRDRLKELTQIFAIDACGYSVMDNHLHTVVRTDPRRAEAWDARDVAERWRRLFPKHKKDGTLIEMTEEELKHLASQHEEVAIWRQRLASLSWFMRTLKEPIARRANKEDGCTGRFWEGRFKSDVLLDEAAVLACCVYVDLNQIRAGCADTPEASDYTSVQDRIRHRQRQARRNSIDEAVQSSDAIGVSPFSKPVTDAEEGIWLAPIQRRVDDETTQPHDLDTCPGVTSLSLDEYLWLVDATGRTIRDDKRGAIPQDLLPILDRLAIDTEKWNNEMCGITRMFGTAVGSAVKRAGEAVRRGTKWVVGAFEIYRKAPVR